jgi:uncharacterized membrane protein
MRDRRFRLAMTAVAAAGLAVAVYLTWVHYAGIKPICASGGGGCERVQNSSYADLAGIPVAVLGVLGYASILASLGLSGEAGVLAPAVLSFVGFGFSAYLTYVELVKIDALCQWCVASAVLMTALAALGGVRVLRAT